MNLVAFKGGTIGADERLIAQLEGLLADAKAGRINSFAGVAINRDTKLGNRYAHNAFNLETLGSTYLLMAWLRDNWESSPRLPEQPPAA